ncbi:Hypothetical predicted protein [Cloeon dipterum]|uniref:Uncharacterized protein n=1 Tax=Cloeon dipterum TaxID=197152 RepID=A0A8S1CX35_9INSE|nr:Hypothetical predicted protein [Cloeon dipterum]
MRWWPAALLALAAAASCAEDVEIIEAQHRESSPRDSYLEAYQQSQGGGQPSHLPQTDGGFHVYGAPVPQYGPAKEEMSLYGPPSPQYGAPPLKQVKEPNMYYGVPHFHHHYTVSEPPPPAEIMEQQSEGHGGFELSTVLKFLAKLFVLKLLVKKIYLIMTLLWLPKVKLLEWLVKKKKTKPAINKPDKPGKPPHSDEVDDIEDEDDDDVMSFFRSSSRGLNDLERRVTTAIHKQAQDNN